jgi:3-oxoacyl-[acyl-carrier protein] reductase
MKNILVTGSSRGLGLEITNLLLENGYKVFGISKGQKESTHNYIHISLDLKDNKNLINKLKEFKNIPFHGLVNNAAIAYDDLLTNMNLEKLEDMYNVNVFSPLLITKFIIRNMLLHKNYGSIVNVSSISVHTGYKGLSMYASSKATLEAFSKNLSREWGEIGIRSNCVVPGFLETDMSSSLNQESINKIKNRSSLKKLTNLKSVAETVLFLLSDKSNSITGQSIKVDCGII